jgi:transposase InsO family protein
LNSCKRTGTAGAAELKNKLSNSIAADCVDPLPSSIKEQFADRASSATFPVAFDETLHAALPEKLELARCVRFVEHAVSEYVEQPMTAVPVPTVMRLVPFKPNAANQARSLDFVSDQLANGMRFRALTVVDLYTRESLAIDVGQRLRGEDVVATLGRLQQQSGAPTYLFCDNGGEFSGRILDLWAYHHRVRIDFSRPVKPTDNAYVESFNGRLREECLNTHWFESINEAKQQIEAWRRDYNESRPHMALGERTPEEFAALMRRSENHKTENAEKVSL